MLSRSFDIMAKKANKIAKVAVVANNEVVNNEIATMVANEIVNSVNTDIPVSDIPEPESEIVDIYTPPVQEINDCNSDIVEVADFSTPPTQDERNYVMIALSDITIDRAANRKAGMDDKSIMEFAKILRRDKGVNSPIQVYHDSGKYKVISGHRRYLASVKAGFSLIPAMIFPKPCRETVFKMRTGENLDRVDLSLIDIAEAMEYSITELGWTRKYTAEWFSLKSHRKYLGADVTKIISLLKLPELYKSLLIAGNMHVASAYKWLKTNIKNPVAAAQATEILEALEDNIENMSTARAKWVVDKAISKASGEEPESEDTLNSDNTELPNSEVSTSESTDSEVTENRINPALKLTPESMFPESEEEPTPVQSRRASPNDITPPTSQNQNDSESDFDVEAKLAEAARSDRNKEMSREQIIAFLYDIEVGVQGFPISGFFEDLMSAIAGNEESKSEMISLLKDLVLAPKKSKKK
jgi:ParB/RepB/Spo0J family partition protein